MLALNLLEGVALLSGLLWFFECLIWENLTFLSQVYPSSSSTESQHFQVLRISMLLWMSSSLSQQRCKLWRIVLQCPTHKNSSHSQACAHYFSTSFYLLLYHVLWNKLLHVKKTAWTFFDDIFSLCLARSPKYMLQPLASSKWVKSSQWIIFIFKASKTIILGCSHYCVLICQGRTTPNQDLFERFDKKLTRQFGPTRDISILSLFCSLWALEIFAPVYR